MNYLGYPLWLVRLLQRGHLRRTRLERLLWRRGIEPAAYLRAFPVVEVETQFARCHECACQPLCDRMVRAPGSGARYSFCPNTSFIDRYRLASRPG